MCKQILNKIIPLKSEEEIAQAKKAANDMLNHLYQSIASLSESTVPLYNQIESYFFQDIDFQLIQGGLSLWMADAGRSPESSWDRILFDKVRQIYCDPMTNRVLHWYDVQNILSAFQDRINATSDYLRGIFANIPAYCLYQDKDYSGSTRGMDSLSDQIHTNINNVFVSLSSAFDLFTKVVYECSRYDPNAFITYKRLKSRSDGILYAKKNYGFEELKDPGLLYDEPACIRTICSFRDEFIHCGSWDYRCSIYYPNIEGEPVEPFIPMPDTEPSGVLVSSGSRNKFYASGSTINSDLPKLVRDVILVLSKTEARLKEVLTVKTTSWPQTIREKKANDYLTLLSSYATQLHK